MSNLIPTTGKIYNDFDSLIKRTELWLSRKKIVIKNCEDSQVRARMVQKIVMLATDSYAAVSKGQCPPPTRFLILNGLIIDQSNGEVTVSSKVFCSQIAIYFLTWFQYLLATLKGFFRATRRASSCTLVMEAGGINNNDFHFAEFCKRGNIPIFAAAEHLIVAHSKPLKSLGANIYYCNDPLRYVLEHYLPKWVAVHMLFKLILAPISYLWSVTKLPLIAIISRDISAVPVSVLLNQQGLIDNIFVTMSFFGSQPLWMKGINNQKFRLNMLWYSQNCIPKMYVGEKEPSNLTPTRHMRVDTHWVWTQGFAKYLREIGQSGDVQIVGPILWVLPRKIPSLGDYELKVAIFDVTPLPDSKMPFGAVKNYYTVKTIKKFVSDIFNVVGTYEKETGKKVLLALKHKRVPKANYHDFSYIKFLETLVESHANFKMIEPETNLFGLMEETDFSISVPYTSTAYVGAAVGKTALYYDPFSELIPRFEKNNLVHMVQGYDRLKNIMYKLFDLKIKGLSPRLEESPESAP